MGDDWCSDGQTEEDEQERERNKVRKGNSSGVVVGNGKAWPPGSGHRGGDVDVGPVALVCWPIRSKRGRGRGRERGRVNLRLRGRQRGCCHLQDTGAF